MRLLVSEARHGLEEAALIAMTGLRELPKTPDIEKAGAWLIAESRVAALNLELTGVVREFHKSHSLLAGIPKQDLKGRVMVDAAGEVFDHILNASAALAQDGEVVRLKGHRVVLKMDEEQARAAIQSAFETAGLTAPAVQEVLKASGIEAARARSILQILLREGKLVRISDELVLPARSVTGLREQLAAKAGQRFGVPEFKEWTAVSRKYAIPLLEYLDREHVTRREGEQRVIL